MATRRCNDSSRKFPNRSGADSAKERSEAILRRLRGYAEKVWGLSRHVVAPVSDRRAKPRMATAGMVKAALTMFWIRRGSLNALALTAPAKSGKEWIGGPLCSADTLGRIAAGLDAQALRDGIHHV